MEKGNWRKGKNWAKEETINETKEKADKKVDECIAVVVRRSARDGGLFSPEQNIFNRLLPN